MSTDRNMHTPLRDLFLLDPDVVFLNHGSFGAVPRPVFDVYQEWQRRLERQPVRFFQRELMNELRIAREALGAYLNAPADDLAFVPNATAAVNIVARSLRLADRRRDPHHRSRVRRLRQRVGPGRRPREGQGRPQTRRASGHDAGRDARRDLVRRHRAHEAHLRKPHHVAHRAAPAGGTPLPPRSRGRASSP